MSYFEIWGPVEFFIQRKSPLGVICVRVEPTVWSLCSLTQRKLSEPSSDKIQKFEKRMNRDTSDVAMKVETPLCPEDQLVAQWACWKLQLKQKEELFLIENTQKSC